MSEITITEDGAKKEVSGTIVYTSSQPEGASQYLYAYSIAMDAGDKFVNAAGFCFAPCDRDAEELAKIVLKTIYAQNNRRISIHVRQMSTIILEEIKRLYSLVEKDAITQRADSGTQGQPDGYRLPEM